MKTVVTHVHVIGRFARVKYLPRWRRVLGHLAKELRRLNSARLGSEKLLQLSSRERVRAVKEALVEHHKGSRRCC
jgi:hypothetical protein